MATEFNPYGLFRAIITTLDANGYPTGIAGASPANGTTNNALYEEHVRGAGWSQAAGVTVNFEGGDTKYGQASFAGGSIDPFELTTHMHHKTWQNMIQGTTQDVTTNSEYPTTGNNPQQAFAPNMGLILTSLMQSRDSATAGQTRYQHYAFPCCTMEWLYGAPSFQVAAECRIRVTPTPVGKDLLGVAWSAAQSFTNNMTDMYDFQTEYPIHLMTFISDGVIVTATPLFKAISAVVTLAATKNKYALQGTLTALTSASVSTGALVYPAAGTATNRLVTMYQHNGVPS